MLELTVVALGLGTIATASVFPPPPLITSSPTLSRRDPQITIVLDTTYQEMDGFGVSEAFGFAYGIVNAPSTAQQQALDLLFNATTGAGFTILRNRIGNGGVGDSIEPNAPSGGLNTSAPAYTWDDDDSGQVFVTTKALAYGNIKYVYADAWGAPAFMKTNDDESDGGYLCGVTGESCSTGDWRQAYAEFLVQYLEYYASIGVSVTHLGFLNEPEFAADYSSMLSDGQQAADFIDILSSTLQAASMDTLITCCDSEGWDNQKNMTAAIVAAGLEDKVGIITSHSYTSQPDGPINTTRKVWQTEYADLNGAWNTDWYSTGIFGEGFYWAQLLQNDIVNSNLSAYLYWIGAETNATDNGCLVSIGETNSTASGRLWALAQWSRYVHPGALRVEALSPEPTLSPSAFLNPDGTVSIQILNSEDTAEDMTIFVYPGSFGSVTAWVGDQSTLGEPVPLAATLNYGTLVGATVPAFSMTTFVLSGTWTVTTTSALPAQTEYGQCGGIGWTGSTVCTLPAVCTVLNPYYSQCL